MSFLIGLSVVLGLFLVVQIIRVFELTSKIKEDDQSQVGMRENRRRALSWPLFVLGYFALFVWVVLRWGPHILPESASKHGEDIDFLFDLNWVILILAYALTHIVLGWFTATYFQRPGTKAQYITHNNKLEMVWTVIPASALAVIVIYGLKTWDEFNGEIAEDAINIELYAKQFDWTARYAGNDNQLGKANFNFINATNPLGLVNDVTISMRIDELNSQITELNEEMKGVPQEGLKEREILDKIAHKESQLAKIHAFKRNNEIVKSAANDDKLVKVEFHIPVGRQVNIEMRSQDVIHSAFLPHFRAQMNCVPGMVTQMRFVPTITTAEMRKKTGNPEFDFILLCNKVCGAAHYNMQMNVIVDTPEDYEKWLAEQTTFRSGLAAAMGTTSLSNQFALNN